MKKSLLLILLISLLALGLAFGAEFIYHINPCILCLAQRVPFVFVMLFCVIGLLQPRMRRGILIIIGILFLVNAGIAAYQIGVEQKLWGLAESGNSQICTANSTADNIKDLYASMTGTPVGDCAHPAFNFHGITFAVMNAALSLGLMLFAFCAARGKSKLKV